ncbi:cell division FtsA domain-containing protein [Candidatus Nomurabacteria bacterium]|nr:cell division FtsA domain-containing protein [Candidatus Nomurabacteria bacterium]
MGIFSGNKKSDKLMLVFDIGSSSVGGALFRTGETGTPKIIKVVREPIALRETLNIDEFLSSTLKTLDAVAGKIHKGGAGAPKAVFAVLSSPWHVSQMRIVRMEKNTPFIFTSKLADSLIQKEIALFEEYLVKYLDKSPVQTIEFKNIKTMLNGYETPNPLNQKVKELEMTIFFSTSGEQVLKKIKEIVGKYFHARDIRFSSFTLASFAVIRDFFTYNEDFLLIDIDGEVTDISLSKKNLLRESVSFPFGSNFIARAAASSFGVPIVEAKSLISLFNEGHAEEVTAQKIGQVMDQLRKDWLAKFQESLVNLSNDISVPSTIYLAVDKENADFFKKTIENEQFHQYTLAESKFKVIFLNAEVFHGMAGFDENAVRDPRLIIDSIYINRFLINSVHSAAALEPAQK